VKVEIKNQHSSDDQISQAHVRLPGKAIERITWCRPPRLRGPTVRPGNQNSSQVRGPGRRRVDLTIAKEFSLRRQMRLQVRFESFNLFNWPQYNNPNTTVTSLIFGRITSVASTRTGQIGLRLTF
jgi:hypothetical protein